MSTLLHWRRAGGGLFGRDYLYVRYEDMSAWLKELAEFHEVKATEHDTKGNTQAAAEYRAAAKWLRIHRGDLALSAAGK